jgi:hypothetical protein
MEFKRMEDGTIAIKSYKVANEAMVKGDALDSLGDRKSTTGSCVGIMAENTSSGTFFYYYPLNTNIARITIATGFDANTGIELKYTHGTGWEQASSTDIVGAVLIEPVDKTPTASTILAGEDVYAVVIRGVGGASSGTNFLSLTDTPSAYTSSGSKLLAVNAGGTAVEFTDALATKKTITIADTVNSECLALVQNDVTNNPDTLLITNTGTGNEIEVNTDEFVVDKGSILHKGQISAPIVTLVDGATITPDFNDGNVQSITLGDNRNMANPLNMTSGARYTLFVIQDGTGSRTITWDTAYLWESGTAPTLSTGAGDVDIIEFISDGTNMYGVDYLDFS